MSPQSQGGYLPLATIAPLEPDDAEGGRHLTSFNNHDTYEYSLLPLKQWMETLDACSVFRPLLFVLGCMFSLLVFKLYTASTSTPLQSVSPSIPMSSPTDSNLWAKDLVNFTPSHPEYLSLPPPMPLIIRLAIITRVDAFERQQAIQESVLVGLKEEDMKVHYRFFVARPREDKGNVRGLETRLALEREQKAYSDVEIIHTFRDVPERLSEKRFEALKWTDSISPEAYDYSMTIDSDTFCCFGALSCRLAHTHPEAKPHQQPIMIGHMAEHLVYFQNTVPDGNTNDSDKDYFVQGPWYKYPVGIGYMLSSNLTKTILQIDPPVAHHINYPSDDVMIGSWVAQLKYYHTPDASFNTTDKYPPAGRVVHPEPLLPYAVDTEIVDDQVGWHDVRKETDDAGTWGKGTIGWDSVCVHQMGIAQMRALRSMNELKDEWKDVRS